MTIGLFYGIILTSNGGFRFNIGWERLTKRNLSRTQVRFRLLLFTRRDRHGVRSTHGFGFVARRYTRGVCNKLACKAEIVRIFAKRNYRPFVFDIFGEYLSKSEKSASKIRIHTPSVMNENSTKRKNPFSFFTVVS